jgi:hypothetical protein
VAGPAAAIAALLYGALVFACVRVGWLVRLSLLLSSLIGGFTGLLGMAAVQFYFTRSFAPVSNGFASIFMLSFVSGALVSFASAHWFPVGANGEAQS